MEEKFAFQFELNMNEAEQLQIEITSRLAAVGVPVSDAFQIEAFPPGAFGFGEGLIKFASDAWKELVKVPGAVLALAEGVKAWLQNRPNGTLNAECANGTKVTIKGNMSGQDIVKVLETMCK